MTYLPWRKWLGMAQVYILKLVYLPRALSELLSPWGGPWSKIPVRAQEPPTFQCRPALLGPPLLPTGP